MFTVVEPAEAVPSEHDAEDADLVRHIAAAPPGSARDAEAELYQRLAPRVRLYGLRHLRSEAAAADLMQQVLLLTLESLRAGRLREPARLASFVLGTCRMVVRDLRRGAERRQQLLEQFGRDLGGAEVSEAQEVDTERLADCLGRLPERDRSVLILTFYAERRTEEVAADLGLSPANVRVIRHRALGRLRRCVTGEGFSS
jgi:RNA polymerase sigma-70 factor (ECF subfamily)